MRHRIARLIAFFVAVMLATTGFASQTLGQDEEGGVNSASSWSRSASLRSLLVGGPEWVNQAAEDMGVQVEYQAPPRSTWWPWRN